MKRRGAILMALGAPLLMGQAKPVLVPDVSQRDIEIAYSFTGAELLLFGAILYPRGRAPDPEDGPVVLGSDRGLRRETVTAADVHDLILEAAGVTVAAPTHH